MARYYVCITLLLYLLGMCFDAVELRGASPLAALQMLLYGPWGVALGLFGWFANPLLGLALLLRRRWRRLALGLGLWALYLALGSAALERLPDSRGDDFHDITGLGPGYYLWVLAFVAFGIGQAWHCWQARRGVEMPRWQLADGLLVLMLAIAVGMASQNPALHFQVEKLFEFRSTWQTGQPGNAI